MRFPESMKRDTIVLAAGGMNLTDLGMTLQEKYPGKDLPPNATMRKWIAECPPAPPDPLPTLLQLEQVRDKIMESMGELYFDKSLQAVYALDKVQSMITRLKQAEQALRPPVDDVVKAVFDMLYDDTKVGPVLRKRNDAIAAGIETRLATDAAVRT